MLQVSTDGISFPTGSVNYIYGPAHEQDKSSRIIFQVEIEGLKTLAVLDTGGVYLVCTPEIGRELKLDPLSAINLEPEAINIRGFKIHGNLHLLNLTILASDGNSLGLQVTAFVPNADEIWLNLPCFLGWQGCLERLRFAIDPSSDTFYFGPCP
jgi:hypothetical protein